MRQTTEDSSTMNDRTKSGLSRVTKLSMLAALFLVIAVLVVVVPVMIRNAKLRAFMADVKAGKSALVTDPDPDCMEDYLRDRDFASRLMRIHVTSSRTISDGRLASLKQFPNLQVIWIEYVEDTDAFLEKIEGMPRLEELAFHHSRFSAAGAKSLSTFPSLKCLRLDRATDTTLRQIRDLTQLQELEIDYGHVTDAGLEHLKRLIRLKRLNLWYTGFSAKGIADLRGALPHCEIVVENLDTERRQKEEALR
jgi:hypothetical protein